MAIKKAKFICESSGRTVYCVYSSSPLEDIEHFLPICQKIIKGLPEGEFAECGFYYGNPETAHITMVTPDNCHSLRAATPLEFFDNFVKEKEERKLRRII